MTHANIVAVLAGKLARVHTRIVISERCTLSIASRNSSFLRGHFLPIARLVYPHADAIVAVSEGVADDLASTLRLPRSKIQAIYNPVVTQQLWDKARETLDHPWFTDGEPPVVISVGRLTRAKDFPTLIGAFALVHREMPARLMILGEGEERSRLESLVSQLGLEKAASLPGFIENPHKYVANASAFVLSSRWEGLPNALIEALVLGTPVVSTDCPSGPREILGNGEFGKLVPVGNVEALAAAIVEALTQKNRGPTAYGAYTLDTAVRRYLEVLGVPEAWAS
jgi:glycosyltransferase involved in cell wall biosynthesis